MCNKCSEAIPKVAAIRAMGDLLQMAADAHNQGRATFADNTLEELGMALEELATDALVILGKEKAKE